MAAIKNGKGAKRGFRKSHPNPSRGAAKYAASDPSDKSPTQKRSVRSCQSHATAAATPRAASGAPRGE
jgi:hypothetical protein